MTGSHSTIGRDGGVRAFEKLQAALGACHARARKAEELAAFDEAAVFGGSNLQVSGPTGAMAVVLQPGTIRVGHRIEVQLPPRCPPPPAARLTLPAN